MADGGKLARLKAWFLCRLEGHPAYPTGWDMAQLRQMWCPRCRRLFVWNPREGQSMLPWDKDFDRDFRLMNQTLEAFK